MDITDKTESPPFTFELPEDFPFLDDLFTGEPSFTEDLLPLTENIELQGDLLPLLEDDPLPGAPPLTGDLPQHTEDLPLPAAIQTAEALPIPTGDPYIHLSPFPAEFLETSQITLWDNHHYLYPDIVSALSSANIGDLTMMPDQRFYDRGDLHNGLRLFHHYNREAFGLPPDPTLADEAGAFPDYGIAPWPMEGPSVVSVDGWENIWVPPPPSTLAPAPAPVPVPVAVPSTKRKADSDTGYITPPPVPGTVLPSPPSTTSGTSSTNKCDRPKKTPRKRRGRGETVAPPGQFIFVENVVPESGSYVSAYSHTREYMVDEKGKVHKRRRYEDGKGPK